MANGGETGIRTLGAREGTTVFEIDEGCIRLYWAIPNQTVLFAEYKQSIGLMLIWFI